MLLRVYALALLVFAGCSGGGGANGDSRSEGTGGAALPVEGVSLEFGTSALGVPRQGTVFLRNPLRGLPVTITSLQVSSGQAAVVPGRLDLPVRMEPGENLDVPIEWTPAANGFFWTTLRVDATGRDPVFVAISGTGFDAEVTVDLGFVPFSNGITTDEIEVDVPANAISFSIEARGGSNALPSGGSLFVDRLIGPSGKVYVDDTDPFVGPYSFERNWPAARLFSVPGAPWVPRDHVVMMLPNTDSPNAQLEPGGGTYRFRVSNNGGSLTGADMRVVIETRPSSSTTSHLDLNVFLANGLIATSLTAATHPHLQQLLSMTHARLAQTGIELGDIDYYDLNDPRFDVADALNPGELFRQSAVARRARLNVFLVMSATGGVAGLSGAIPGPRALGNPVAGVFSIGSDAINPEDLGSVLAHEILHYLGLGHTREAVGNPFPWTYDIIDDTCPGTGCTGNLSAYLMDANFNPVTATLVTPGQASVVRGHVLVDPGAGSFSPWRATASASPLLETARLVAPACGCSR